MELTGGRKSLEVHRIGCSSSSCEQLLYEAAWPGLGSRNDHMVTCFDYPRLGNWQVGVVVKGHF